MSNAEYLELKFISEIKKRANTVEGDKRERSVEDFFVFFFGGIPGFKASRADAPRLKFHKTLYTDGVVSFNNEIFTVFEFKKGAIKFTSKNELLFNQEENVVYAQAIKYILCSNSEKFASELKFNKVLLFNGSQIVKISVNPKSLKEIYSKLNWDNALNSFLNDQRNLSSFLQNIILTKFNTIKPFVEFSFILDTGKGINESEVLELYKELTEVSDAKISIIRMNLKEKFSEFSGAFDNSLIQNEAVKLPYLSNLVLRIFIEVSVHINDGINCILSRDNKIADFQVQGRSFNIYYTEENDQGEMFDRPVTICASYIENLNRLNEFFRNHIINNLDVLYEDYDNLISDERTRKSIGLYFTKSDLSHLCYEFLTRVIPVDILKTCHFYDPAAGSGNLLKAQEDFISVIGSDIKKMSQDIMRNRHINVPKREIDFFQTTREEMVSELNSIVEKNGRNFIDNPLLIIMNPPYRGKNTWVEQGQIGNKIGVSRDETYLGDEFIKILRSNKIRSNDLSSFFILKALTFYLFDKYYGYIATFSPTNWLNPGRGEHDEFRKFISSHTKFVGGFIINGKKFFDNLNSNLTIAFSIFQLDKDIIKSENKKDFTYFDLYKDHNKIKELFELKQFKNWEPSYLDSDESKLKAKEKYKKLADQIFNEAKIINFSKNRDEKVYFKDIFRAINSQTGDDQKVLLHIENNFRNLDLSKVVTNTEISNDEIYIVATDKPNGYDIAIKPKEKKKRGCVFSIPRSIDGPIMAWHYLWDYLATYPTRFYNAVPITKKYAFTYIDPKPLLNIDDIKNSRTCKLFSFIQKNELALDYIKEWQKKIGDLRGLFFFFFALTHSDIAENMAKDVLYKNSPIWCPELKKENIDHIKTVIQIGTAFAIYKFGQKFQEFTLSRKGVDIIETENYFSVKSNWFKKSKIPEMLFDIKKETIPIVKNIIAGNLSEKKIRELLNKAVSEIDSY
jgi:hypothetical protein